MMVRERYTFFHKIIIHQVVNILKYCPGFDVDHVNCKSYLLKKTSRVCTVTFYKQVFVNFTIRQCEFYYRTFMEVGQSQSILLCINLLIYIFILPSDKAGQSTQLK